LDTRFKPGQKTLNPRGRPKGSKTPKAAMVQASKVVSIETLARIIQLTVMSDISALKAIVDNPSSPALEVALATSIIIGIKKGDWPTIERILTWVLGKVPDQVHIKQTTNLTGQISIVDKDKLKAAIDELENEY